MGAGGGEGGRGYLRARATLSFRTGPRKKLIYVGPDRLQSSGLCESRGGRPGLQSLINLRFLWT